MGKYNVKIFNFWLTCYLWSRKWNCGQTTLTYYQKPSLATRTRSVRLSTNILDRSKTVDTSNTNVTDHGEQNKAWELTTRPTSSNLYPSISLYTSINFRLSPYLAICQSLHPSLAPHKPSLPHLSITLHLSIALPFYPSVFSFYSSRSLSPHLPIFLIC